MAEPSSMDILLGLLQKCRQQKNLCMARHLHACMLARGFDTHRFIGNYLVLLLVECGALCDALQIFGKLPHHDVYSWTSLISAAAECGEAQDACSLYHGMQDEPVRPSNYTFVALLKACVKQEDADRNRKIHAEIIRHGFDTDLLIGNLLVDVYAKLGMLDTQHVFNSLPCHNVYSWTSLIFCYINCEETEYAFHLYQKMQEACIQPNNYTFVALLKARTKLQDMERNKAIHADIVKNGLENDQYIGNSLVDMYAKGGSFAEACSVFGKLPFRDTVSWNSLISGYAEHGLGKEALGCFEQMQLEDAPPDVITFACSLKACADMQSIEVGQRLSTDVFKKGLETVQLVTNTMVDMYAKCGLLAEAQDVFAKHPQSTVSWNTLIAAYADCGIADNALTYFKQMCKEGVLPDHVTFPCSLKACGALRTLETGQQIHTDLTKRGLDTDTFVGSTLVDMYGKCGCLTEACNVLENLSPRDVVSWNALIVVYADYGLGEETLKCFEQMQLEGILPAPLTYVCSLKGCSVSGALETGGELHTKIIKRGLEMDLVVGNALIDMYGKCCSLAEAWKVFNSLGSHDIVSWNALINSYSENQEASMVMKCFEDMRKQHVKPNAATFTCLLAACSHTSLVHQGQEYFKLMKEQYEIEPTVDHYSCMVDLLARSGSVFEAERLAKAVNCLLSEGTLKALLSASNVHGEVELGLRSFQQLFRVKKEDASAYFLMANTFAGAGMHSDACIVEEMRRHEGLKKLHANASIEVRKKLFEFSVGDNQKRDVSSTLETWNCCLRHKGHVPNLELVLTQIMDNESIMFLTYQ